MKSTANKSLTLFFIVEPPAMQFLACYLAASIRENLGWKVRICGYCPEDSFRNLDNSVMRCLEKLDCPVKKFSRLNVFNPEYPHGNKILASMENRGSDFSCFLDSDIVFRQSHDILQFCLAGTVSVAPSTNPGPTTEEMWATIYSEFDMPLPEERVRFTRKRRGEFIPYFNAGVIYFDENHRSASNQSFPEIWLDTALRIEKIDGIAKKRPYLDQYSLQVAIARANMNWNILPDEQNFSLGGRMRHKPLPVDKEITVVHYRHWGFLAEAGIADSVYDLLGSGKDAEYIRHFVEIGKIKIHDHPDFQVAPKETL